jgi:hypothetical protein
MKTVSLDMDFPLAPPVTDFSFETKRLLWWEAEIAQSKKQLS